MKERPMNFVEWLFYMVICWLLGYDIESEEKIYVFDEMWRKNFAEGGLIYWWFAIGKQIYFGGYPIQKVFLKNFSDAFDWNLFLSINDVFLVSMRPFKSSYLDFNVGFKEFSFKIFFLDLDSKMYFSVCTGSPGMRFTLLELFNNKRFAFGTPLHLYNHYTRSFDFLIENNDIINKIYGKQNYLCRDPLVYKGSNGVVFFGPVKYNFNGPVYSININSEPFNGSFNSFEKLNIGVGFRITFDLGRISINKDAFYKSKKFDDDEKGLLEEFVNFMFKYFSPVEEEISLGILVLSGLFLGLFIGLSVFFFLKRERLKYYKENWKVELQLKVLLNYLSSKDKNL